MGSNPIFRSIHLKLHFFICIRGFISPQNPFCRHSAADGHRQRQQGTNLTAPNTLSWVPILIRPFLMLPASDTLARQSTKPSRYSATTSTNTQCANPGIGTMELVYTIKRSARRRKLTITVERDRRVFLHVPEGTSDEKIRQVVESKRQWIYEKIGHYQKYRILSHPQGKELVSGGSALYLGRHYRIEVAKTGLAEIKFVRGFLVPALQPNKRTELFRDWYISNAKEKIVPRVQYHAREIGVDVAKPESTEGHRWTA